MTTNKLSPVSVDEMDFATPKHQTFIVRGQSHQNEALIALREHVLIGIPGLQFREDGLYTRGPAPLCLKFSSIDSAVVAQPNHEEKAS